MHDWHVISDQEILKRIPEMQSQRQSDPYQLESKKWVLPIQQMLPIAEDNERFAREAVISAITSPHACAVIVAIVGANITTVYAHYPCTETLSEQDVLGAIAAHAIGAPIIAPFHVPGHRMKLLANELKFVPSTAVGVLVVHKHKISSHGNIGISTWLRILQAM